MTTEPRLGLRANAAQFSLLVAVNALVGGMLGQERTVLPLLAERVFHLKAYTAALTFILAFGVAKALTNYLAGAWSERYGRKPVLVAGWLVAIPVPLLLGWAPGWGWIVAANLLLGISQGLTWSTTVIMKIDLVGPQRRGLAMGLNEAAGYGALAATALATGYLGARFGLRPQPFYLGIAYAAIGFGLAAGVVRETRGHALLEASRHPAPAGAAAMSPGRVFAATTWREPALSAASQAGLVNNLNDGLAWGLFPVLFATAGLSVGRIGVLAALYPAVWGFGQLATGAWSDRVGRKPLVVSGMLVQAVALGLVAGGRSFAAWALAATMLGVGTALVYPTLLAVIGDVAHPAWRARSLGVYRLWRDAGFAAGALLAGVLADLFSVRAAIWAVAIVTAGSGLLVLARMPETRRGIDAVLAAARRGLDRVRPEDLAAEMAAGALVVDTRPVEQRDRDGVLPGAVVVDRNVLEWRLDPNSPFHLPELTDLDLRVIVVCNQGYSSSLAAATLRRVGLRRATDLAGGFEAWRRLAGPDPGDGGGRLAR